MYSIIVSPSGNSFLSLRHSMARYCPLYARQPPFPSIAGQCSLHDVVPPLHDVVSLPTPSPKGIHDFTMSVCLCVALDQHGMAHASGGARRNHCECAVLLKFVSVLEF
jgi:hypothetical protein